MQYDSPKELLEFLAKCLVDNPEQVVVNEHENTEKQSMCLTLEVAKPDAGKVIGKNGQTADALRTILRAAGAKLKKRYQLEIKD